MIIVDGSYGEGGGQILRTSLALSLVTGKSFKIVNIRANRRKSGLLKQHLTAVKAASQIGMADIKGAELGSQELTFVPSHIKTGEYKFEIGTAGSTTLVLQAVLPALITSEESSRLHITGGTHNPSAPSFDYLDNVFFPLIEQMGYRLFGSMASYGFYPAGGGSVSFTIEKSVEIEKFEMMERGDLKRISAKSIVSQIPKHVADRELKVVADTFQMSGSDLVAETTSKSDGPGNVLIIEVESENITEMFTGFGQRGVTAEKVAKQLVRSVQKYISADVPVGEHLADQLLIPMALAGGGRFVTMDPTQHTITNMETIKKFLDVNIVCVPYDDTRWEVSVKN